LSRPPRDLHSFPTRRSSDLRRRRSLFFVRRLINFQCAVSDNQRIDGLLTVLTMYRQFEALRQKSLHHFGSATRRLPCRSLRQDIDRKSTRLNSSHYLISYAV